MAPHVPPQFARNSPRPVEPIAQAELLNNRVVEEKAVKPKDEFMWDYNEEPHASRRAAILKKYPEVKKLFGHEPATKYIVLGLVSTQLALSYLMRDSLWTLQHFLVAYVIGATINHSLFLAIHEISHNLAFKAMTPNKILSFVANIPIGIPYSTAFKGYHMEHHRYQGVEGVDTDLPTSIEAKLLSSNRLGKLFFCTFQIFFYALRPMFVRRQAITGWHLANWAFQAVVVAAMVYFWGINSWIYFLTCTVLSGSLHPLAGHFLSEHYVVNQGFETYSYYGPLNMLAFNVGYHNEHHDFPFVAGSRLPALKKMAPEFYDDLPQCSSWPMMIYHFIMDDNLSLYSRVKRPNKKNI
eukprot:Colp12_sorted_trinity150504_noHs@18385